MQIPSATSRFVPALDKAHNAYKKGRNDIVLRVPTNKQVSGKSNQTHSNMKDVYLVLRTWQSNLHQQLSYSIDEVGPAIMD